MNARDRLLTAVRRRIPDRLPATTHHLMPTFLAGIGGISAQQFFDDFGLDAIRWIPPSGSAADPNAKDWVIENESASDPCDRATRFRIITPRGILSTVLKSDGRTEWVTERLIKKRNDLELIALYAPSPVCDVEFVNGAAASLGDRGIVRGSVPGFPIYGQPGCWQDAAVLYGIENLIYATNDDPVWVDELLQVLQRRKLSWLRTTQGARFDLLELGGGDASSTVISPRIFDRYVAPFDEPLIAAAHAIGQRVVYHTCGGMMPILERLADMEPDALETFTPRSMGGDADLHRAKLRIGERVCMIGGFDQFHHFVGCPAEETRRAVRRCFEEAGAGGGYILAPSDHFFEADAELIKAFADEARLCRYH